MTTAPARLPSPTAPAARERVLYEAAALSDYALRTGLASLAAAASLPWIVAGRWQAERRALECYAELADAADPEQVFRAPERVSVTRQAGRPRGIADGRVEVLRFRSPYVAINPALRRSYAAHANNAIARAQHWRHDDGPPAAARRCWSSTASAPRPPGSTRASSRSATSTRRGGTCCCTRCRSTV